MTYSEGKWEREDPGNNITPEEVGGQGSGDAAGHGERPRREAGGEG